MPSSLDILLTADFIHYDYAAEKLSLLKTLKKTAEIYQCFIKDCQMKTHNKKSSIVIEINEHV